MSPETHPEPVEKFTPRHGFAGKAAETGEAELGGVEWGGTAGMEGMGRRWKRGETEGSEEMGESGDRGGIEETGETGYIEEGETHGATVTPEETE